MNEKRVLKLNSNTYTSGPIMYWMNRDQRAEDNWALLFAQQLALENKVPLLVMFNLVPNFLGGITRQYQFKLTGLREVEQSLTAKNIPFFILVDEEGKDTVLQIEAFCAQHRIGALVTDFSPLRNSRNWVQELRELLRIPIYGVDAHNIVPCWIASEKLEYGAYTIRPKLHRLLPEYLEEFPQVQMHQFRYEKKIKHIDWNALGAFSPTVAQPSLEMNIISGSKAAHALLTNFISRTLPHYAVLRNDPNAEHQSDLSPYLHYGQIAPQRVALEIVKLIDMPITELLAKDKNNAKVHLKGKLMLADHASAFLEELIVRRELSDNFCFYHLDYDSPLGFPDWAKKSHERHKDDKREYAYTKEQFERAETHDDLWNACQQELLKSGKMHGYMRMYWAKKILEWTPSVEEAMEIAIYLNDRYELDGRDPNGYAGIAWSMGGVHDRAWFDRPVFGQIRYMNRNGCATKFKVDAYIKRWVK